MTFALLNHKCDRKGKAVGDGDTMQLIYTEGIEKSHDYSKSTAKKNLLCTLFLLFILIAMLAMAYVVFQGTQQRASKRDYIIESHEPRGYLKRWSVKVMKVPPYQDKAATARFVVHTSDWAALATNSIHLPGFPFAAIVSISDGLKNNSTGIPYIYVTTLAPETRDVLKDPRASLVVTEGEGKLCSSKGLDAEDPRCAKAMLIGKLFKVPKDEIEYAKKIYFTRHPGMRLAPGSHHFFFMKMNITRVEVLDYFGGVAVVTPKEYFAASPYLL